MFQAQLGFYDSVVAVPSQPAALRAWGTHQNLFAQGQAWLATDQAAIKAALEHPRDAATPAGRLEWAVRTRADRPADNS